MKVVAAYASPHQDDVIEAILRARGEWNPPWQRRAPPENSRRSSRPREPPILDEDFPQGSPDWTEADLA